MKVMKPAITYSLTVMLWLVTAQAFALSEEDFQETGRKYGVSPYLLKAIATVESRNGELVGKYKVSEVVNETQLKYLKKIARKTERALSEFKGSRAGAMGYMQIMPSTFYLYGQSNPHHNKKINDRDHSGSDGHWMIRPIWPKELAESKTPSDQDQRNNPKWESTNAAPQRK